jgi:hypothetical protein
MKDLWRKLRAVKKQYESWRSAQVSARRWRPSPVREGHFHVLNQLQIEDAIIDYRVFHDFSDGGAKFRVVSSLLNHEERGFDSPEEAYNWMKHIVSTIQDEAGFNITILKEDNEKVFDFPSPPHLDPGEIRYPTDNSQNDW